MTFTCSGLKYFVIDLLFEDFDEPYHIKLCEHCQYIHAAILQCSFLFSFCFKLLEGSALCNSVSNIAK